MNDKISVFGSTGFIGSRFSAMYEKDIVEITRDVYTTETNNILYFINTVVRCRRQLGCCCCYYTTI